MPVLSRKMAFIARTSLLLLCLLKFQTVKALPIFNSFDKVATLSETVNTNTVLSTIDCTDDGGGLTSVGVASISPTSPCGSCFAVLSCGTADCLEYRAGTGTLSASSASSYQVTIECSNGIDSPATETIFVIIQPNQPPYFNPEALYETGQNTGFARGITAGTSLYQVAAVDDDTADTVEFFMTTFPLEFNSMFTIGSTNGIIEPTVDMAAVCTRELTFEVTASDGRSGVGPKVIAYSLNTPNQRPYVTNLGAEIHLPEDHTGTFLAMRIVDTFTFSRSYTYSSTNTAGLAQFNLDGSTLNLAPVGTLDYEDASLRETDIAIQFTDGFCLSENKVLRIVVKDVNEEPVISPTNSNYQVCEGTETFDPGLTVTDEDVGDTHKWYLSSTMGNVQGFFNIQENNGVFVVSPDYDVDKNRRPGTVNYIVEVEDSGGLTATATVTVQFLDCNDNPPIFDQPAYTFTTTACTAGGTTLGTVAASDDDSTREDNNVITYSGSGGAVTINTAGDVILNTALAAGTVLDFNAVATDGGQPSLASDPPGKVSIIFTECPTTPPPVTTAAPAAVTTAAPITTTTLAPNSASMSGSLGWIIAAAIGGLLFTLLFSFMCWKFGALIRCPSFNSPSCKCKNPCKKKPRPRRVQNRGPAERPDSPPPMDPPPQPGFIYAFWKERYPDNDYKSQPDRSSMPKPGNLDPVYPHTIDTVEDPLDADELGPINPERKSGWSFCPCKKS